MKFEELTAVRVVASLDQHDIKKTMNIIAHALDISEHVQPIEANGVKYTSVMFIDHSMMAFHWEADASGIIESVDCFMMFAYQQEKDIPQCVLDNSQLMGTLKYAIIPTDHPETLQ